MSDLLTFVFYDNALVALIHVILRNTRTTFASLSFRGAHCLCLFSRARLRGAVWPF